MSPERKYLVGGLSSAAWGYFFLNFDINLGTVSILPRFAGFLILLATIDALSVERRDLPLLRPLCILLAAWAGINWLFSWRGADLDGLFPPLDLIIAAAGLYFHFQFLTDMAVLAERYQPEGGNLDQKLRRRRTVYVVACTAGALLTDLRSGLPAGLVRDWAGPAALVCALAGMAAALAVMFGLFALRQCAMHGEPGEKDETYGN